jgi:DNA-binding Xre family transcriptional regulator
MSSISSYAILKLDMIKLRLKDCLDANGLSVYRLEKECPEVSRTTLYKLAAGEVDGVRFNTLNAVLIALARLTGKPVTPNDLLEVIEEPVQPDPEEAWLNSSAGDLKAMLEDVERNEKPKDVAKWTNAFAQAAQ